MLKVGDSLPAVSLQEYVEEMSEGCAIGPQSVDVLAEARQKNLVVFGLPGAFTPTCSVKHVPGYIEEAERFKAAGIDEIWCVSVNDAFVMGAWGREQEALGKVRMLADGSADFARATGLLLDLTSRGMGLRSQRYSMLIVQGVIKALNVEVSGGFEVSDASSMLQQVEHLLKT